MNGTATPCQPSNGTEAPALAGAPALPSLKKDNSTRTGRYKAVFVAEENIRLYIARFGEPHIGLLTVTTPSPCLQAFEFQRMWHSFQTHAVKDWFKTGMWVRERQPRSGNWHAHAVVNVGWPRLMRRRDHASQPRMARTALLDLLSRRPWSRLGASGLTSRSWMPEKPAPLNSVADSAAFA